VKLRLTIDGAEDHIEIVAPAQELAAVAALAAALHASANSAAAEPPRAAGASRWRAAGKGELLW
jgi:hypothetical protein